MKVYNLEVEQAHTYFVLAEHAPADADAVWVHNAQYVFDGSTGRYRDATNGQFISAKDLPWPPHGGFASGRRQTMKASTVLDRYGKLSGTYLSTPGESLSRRGMAPGSDVQPYTKYRVVKAFEAKVGPAAGVPQFDASGGALQYRHIGAKNVQWLLDNKHIVELK